MATISSKAALNAPRSINVAQAYGAYRNRRRIAQLKRECPAFMSLCEASARSGRPYVQLGDIQTAVRVMQGR